VRPFSHHTRNDANPDGIAGTGQIDRHEVEAVGAAGQSARPDDLARGRAEPAALLVVQRIFRGAVDVPAARLDLDEAQNVSVQGDDVDFPRVGEDVALENAIAGPAQSLAGGLLSDRPALPAKDPSTPRCFRPPRQPSWLLRPRPACAKG
jgi:hypothetical protein